MTPGHRCMGKCMEDSVIEKGFVSRSVGLVGYGSGPER
jgi:hypothetical protein